MEEDCCIDDALLADVVAKAKVARKSIRSTYHDPEEAWIDAYLEGWFEGHFRTLQETTQEEHKNAQQSSEVVFQ